MKLQIVKNGIFKFCLPLLLTLHLFIICVCGDTFLLKNYKRTFSSNIILSRHKPQPHFLFLILKLFLVVTKLKTNTRLFDCFRNMMVVLTVKNVLVTKNIGMVICIASFILGTVWIYLNFWRFEWQSWFNILIFTDFLLI